MANRPSFKTRGMERAERRVGQQLEEYLPAAYKAKNQEQIAAELGVTGATVSRWMRDPHFDIETRLTGQRPPEAAVA